MTVSLDAFDDEYEDELTPAQLVALDAMDGGSTRPIWTLTS